jgi:hypothetical protein
MPLIPAQRPPIPRYDTGGGIGLPDVPNVDVNIIPTAQSMPGKGPPQPPKPAQTQSPMQSAQNMAGIGKSLSGLGSLFQGNPQAATGGLNAGSGSLQGDYSQGLGFSNTLNSTYQDQLPAFADGGMPELSEMSPWWTRREASEAFHPGGLFQGGNGGRTDTLNRIVPAGSYVIPADVVSGLGEGNTMAGANVLDAMMHTNPHGVQGSPQRMGKGPPHAPAAYREPSETLARGGKTGHVPIVAAGGEYLVHPEAVQALGGGDIKRGHAILDAFVVHIRKKTKTTLSKLPPPKK